MSESHSRAISIFPFLIIGIIGGALLAFLIPYISNIPAGILTFPSSKLPQLHLKVLLYYWISFYGVMYLLSYPTAKSLKQLAIVTLIPSLIASLPYFWASASTPSQFFLMLFSAYAINAFHIHYEENGMKIYYPTLFYAVWDTMVKIVIALFFTLLCWSILYLCASLFNFIGIHFFKQLIGKNWFVVWASAFFISQGLYIATHTHQVLQNIRMVLLVMCKFLLAPLAIISLLFIASLLITFHQHHLSFKSEALFSSIAFLSVIFLNGTYQDGLVEKPYPLFLLWISRVFICVTPLFSALALYTVYFYSYNNVHTNGFNLNNLPCFLNLILLFIYTLTYAIIGIVQYKVWFKGIERANIVLAILLIITTLISTSPLITRHFNQGSDSRINRVL